MSKKVVGLAICAVLLALSDPRQGTADEKSAADRDPSTRPHLRARAPLGGISPRAARAGLRGGPEYYPRLPIPVR